MGPCGVSSPGPLDLPCWDPGRFLEPFSCQLKRSSDHAPASFGPRDVMCTHLDIPQNM